MPGRLFAKTFCLTRAEQSYRASFALAAADLPFLENGADQWLSAEELSRAAEFRFERRRASFLLGRFCAKRALADWAGESDPRRFAIYGGVFGQPLVAPAAGAGVSLTHAGQLGAALAFDLAHPMGIDLEIARPERRDALLSQTNAAELSLLAEAANDPLQAAALLWTAKEALSKVLGTGCMAPFRLFAVSAVRRESGWIVSEFKDFAQYKALSACGGAVWISIVLPRRTEAGLAADEVIGALAKAQG